MANYCPFLEVSCQSNCKLWDKNNNCCQIESISNYLHDIIIKIKE